MEASRYLSYITAKKRLRVCWQPLPADINDLVLQVCVCLCVFAFETKKFTLRISLNVSSCEAPSLSGMKLMEQKGSGRIVSDRREPDRRMRGGGVWRGNRKTREF